MFVSDRFEVTSTAQLFAVRQSTHPLPRGVTVERDGSFVRFFGLAGRGFVVYRDLGGLEGVPKLDELIARQVNVFAERDERVEWKLHGHGQPGDHSERLRAARVRRIGWYCGRDGGWAGDPTPLRRRGTAVARPSL